MEDLFIERIYRQRKNIWDQLKVLGLFALYFICIFVVLMIPVLFFLLPFVAIGGGYLVFILALYSNLEHEYIVTNGQLDIDRIYGKRRRKRFFSIDAKDIEILAPTSDSAYPEYQKNSALKKLDLSSRSSERQWFLVGSYKGQRMLILVDGDQKVLEGLWRYSPSKIHYRPGDKA